MGVVVADVITCAKFQIEIFSGYGFTGGQIFYFPIDCCVDDSSSYLLIQSTTLHIYWPQFTDDAADAATYAHCGSKTYKHSNPLFWLWYEFLLVFQSAEIRTQRNLCKVQCIIRKTNML